MDLGDEAVIAGHLEVGPHDPVQILDPIKADPGRAALPHAGAEGGMRLEVADNQRGVVPVQQHHCAGGGTLYLESAGQGIAPVVAAPGLVVQQFQGEQGAARGLGIDAKLPVQGDFDSVGVLAQRQAIVGPVQHRVGAAAEEPHTPGAGLCIEPEAQPDVRRVATARQLDAKGVVVVFRDLLDESVAGGD